MGVMIPMVESAEQARRLVVLANNPREGLGPDPLRLHLLRRVRDSKEVDRLINVRSEATYR
jgi:2-keto-3-deoxy-L-rhamnonate aldolase RhmA